MAVTNLNHLTGHDRFPMALSEIDPSSLPTSKRIRRHEFGTVRRGYDQVQVRDYLKRIAGHVAALDHKLARLEGRTANEAGSSSTQSTEDPHESWLRGSPNFSVPPRRNLKGS